MGISLGACAQSGCNRAGTNCTRRPNLHARQIRRRCRYSDFYGQHKTRETRRTDS